MSSRMALICCFDALGLLLVLTTFGSMFFSQYFRNVLVDGATWRFGRSRNMGKFACYSLQWNLQKTASLKRAACFHA